MKTAAYTICKNEIDKVEQWVYYTKDFDYRVVLDTGSTDGTYEELKKVSGIIIDQFIMDDFRFDVPRNKNLNMVPKDVDWCLSPDLDEYFSVNVLEQIEKTKKENPSVTNVACTRLDIFSKEVFVGPPKHIGTNKIHKRFDYDWKMPIYEHLSYIGDKSECEIFNYDIFLIHDQNTNKPRSSLYFDLLRKEFKNNPKNTWNSWFLANEYYIKQDLENFVEVGIFFCTYTVRKDIDSKYKEVFRALIDISRATNVPEEIRNKIKNNLNLIVSQNFIVDSH